MVSKLIKYIESHSKLDIQENYFYDINLNRYKLKSVCKFKAFASLFKDSSTGNISYHIYNEPIFSHIINERDYKNDILCIRLRIDSDFSTKLLNKKYTDYKHAIITVSM